jgi:oligopeptide/dipeptide ABC transporter ATP-binding protein
MSERDSAALAAPGSEEGEPLLRIRDLVVHFPITKGVLFKRRVGTVRAVDGVSFNVQKGQTVGVVGESGSGKTTTGRAIVRLNRPTSGSILFDGQELVGLEGEPLRRVRRQIQMVFQDPYSSLDPRMIVGSIVSEPLRAHRLGTSKERADRAGELLDIVGLSPHAARQYPHEFSGGQRQRIGLARALALHPDLIVADEPISALDVSIRAQILNLLSRLQREFGLTYLLIAHDLGAVRWIADHVVVMYLGRVMEEASTAELFGSPLHPYTVALLSAVPIPNPVLEAGRERIVLSGDVPSPAALPTGCRFHPRCWLRQELGNPSECEDTEPPLRRIGGAHPVACHFAERVEGSAAQERVTGGRGPLTSPRSPD